MRFITGSESIVGIPGEYHAGLSLKELLREILELFSLFAVTAFLVYFTPKIYSQIYILGVLLVFVRSKRNYFWIAFFLILYSTPLALFSESVKSIEHRLPLFNIAPGMSLDTINLFIVVSFMKALFRPRAYAYLIQGPMIGLFLYFVVLVGLAVLVHDSDISTIVDQLRFASGFSLLFSLPRLLRNRHEIDRFLHLIFPSVIPVFLGGVYFLVTNGEYFYNILSPDQDLFKFSFIGNSDYTRFCLHGAQFDLIFIVFILSLVKQNLIFEKSKYLVVLAILCFTTIIIAALRHWFVIFSIIFLAYLISTTQKTKNIAVFLLVSMIIYSFMTINENTKGGIIAAWGRTSTVFQIGDKDSISRKTIEFKRKYRLPKQIQFIKENPVTGWGFTKRTGDPDVGNFALLVEVGYFGFIFFVILWMTYLKRLHGLIRNKAVRKEQRNALKIFFVGFIGLLISHFTTNQIFGLYTFSIMLSMYLYISDHCMKESIHELDLST